MEKHSVLYLSRDGIVGSETIYNKKCRAFNFCIGTISLESSIFNVPHVQARNVALARTA